MKMKRIKITMLIIAFILSQDYIWNAMYGLKSWIAGNDTGFFDYEIMIRSFGLCLFALFSIFFTDDGVRFEKCLEKHSFIKAIVERVLRLGAVIVYGLAFISRMVLVADEKDKSIIKEERKKAKEKISAGYNEMLSSPLLIRFIIANSPLIIAISLIQLYSRDTALFIISITSHVAAVVGLVCNCANCTDDLISS